MEKHENLIASFVEAGENQVRRNVAGKLYGDPDGWQSRLAEDWIRQREAERAAADRAGEMALATRAAEADERAADAADRAATAAHRANIIAIAAAVMAAIAIGVSIYGLVTGKGH